MPRRPPPSRPFIGRGSLMSCLWQGRRRGQELFYGRPDLPGPRPRRLSGDAGLRPLLPPELIPMPTLDLVLGGLTVAVLLAYLGYALIKPEKF
ncbi:potassium-transporting ATPase subunit F [Stagnimonas aquatica]|uniref:Potassium-transporting ATPase subunit F n=1 Tax=Stagnimonas aquatica TaxID=2689987 RepID=A0A3N0V845_9GAMM|nr:potassium-transporting ATPase subunit F [Stagnimonas aquatica]